MELILQPLGAPAAGERPVEVVERKGLGHPDSVYLAGRATAQVGGERIPSEVLAQGEHARVARGASTRASARAGLRRWRPAGSGSGSAGA